MCTAKTAVICQSDKELCYVLASCYHRAVFTSPNMFYKYPQTDVRASLPAAENQAESFPFLGNGSKLRGMEKNI